MHINLSILPLHRTAVLASVNVVNSVGPADLDRPTPCAGWALADLLTHMTAQHRGFAAAARSQGADLAAWDVAAVADAVLADPAGSYAAAAADVLEAFDRDGVLDSPFALPEFGPDASLPGSMAIGFHFVDYVVHGWDVARSLGAAFELPDDVVSAALPLALAVPDGDIRAAENSPFAAAVSPADGGTALDRMLAHLGRAPSWPGEAPPAATCD